MIIVLKDAYSVGDLAPDVSYPHVYITTFYVNGPGQNATITYEVGTFDAPTGDTPMGLWHKAQQVPTFTLQLNGAELYPFFTTQVQPARDAMAATPEDDSTDPVTPAQPGSPAVSGNLWDQVETLLYQLIQKSNTRLEGSLV